MYARWDHGQLTGAPELDQRCLAAFDHEPRGHRLCQRVSPRRRGRVGNKPAMRARALFPATLHRVWEEEISYGDSYWDIEVDVRDPGETAKDYADVTLAAEVVGDFLSAQLALLPVLEDRALAVKRGHHKTPAMVLQGRLYGVPENGLAKVDERQRFLFDVRVVR